MATIGAARAISLDHQAGSLEQGKRADFLVVKPSRLPAPEEITGAVIEESQIEERSSATGAIQFSRRWLVTDK